MNWHSQQIATFDRSARLANKSGRSYGSDEIDRFQKLSSRAGWKPTPQELLERSITTNAPLKWTDSIEKVKTPQNFN